MFTQNKTKILLKLVLLLHLPVKTGYFSDIPINEESVVEDFVSSSIEKGNHFKLFSTKPDMKLVDMVLVSFHHLILYALT